MTLNAILTRHLLIIVILVIVVSIYGNTLWNGFTYDDWDVIRDSSLVKNPKLVSTLFTKNYFTTSGEATYRPIVTLTYFLEYRIGQDRPWGYHLMNLVYHLIMVLLIYLWFAGYLGKWPAAGAALIFGIHPALSEAVNSIGFREDILAGVFFMSALLLHRAHLTAPARLKSIFAIIFVIMALLSKEMAITFLPLCILTDYIFSGKLTVKQQWKQYLGYSLVSLGYLILRFWLMANPVKESVPYYGGNIIIAILSIPKIIGVYLQLIAYPNILNIDRDVPPLTSIADAYFWFGLMLLLGIGYLIYKSEKRYRWASLWFLITLLPVLNIIPIYNPVGERYLYLPLIGFVSLIAFTLQKYQHNKMVWIFLVICILGLSTRTIIRNHDWRNDTTLFTSAVQSPSGPRVHYNYANVLREQGNVKEAVAEYQIALEKAPRFVQAWGNLGTLYDQQGNYQEAVTSFYQGLALQPNSAQLHNGLGITLGKLNQLGPAVRELQTAIHLKADYSEAHYNLGLIYLKLQDTNRAISELQTAIYLNPAFITAYDILGSIYLSLGRLNDLIFLLQIETRNFPDRIDAFQDLGKTYLQVGQVIPAIDTFNIVLHLNPNYAPALNNLAWIYATYSATSIRNGGKAVELALKAANLTQFNDSGTLDTLAAAYAETGDFNQAIVYQEKAIALAPPQVKKDLSARLRLYQKRLPFREP